MTEGETRFQTTAEAVLAAGELSVDAPAEALEPGRSGNAAAGTIVILTGLPGGDHRMHQSGALHRRQ